MHQEYTIPLKAALNYVKQGLPVFPCCWSIDGKCACGRGHQGRDVGKVPLTPHGLKDAAILSSTVKQYWSRWPNANIGIAIPASHLVLDVDIKHNGFESLGALQQKNGALPPTWLVTTGSGGQHYWYKTERPIRNTTGLGGYSGLDIRGYGGYVIAPPSMHQSGNRYEPSPIWNGNIAPAPGWLMKLCVKPIPQSSTVDTETPIPEGQRNDTLTRDAGAMRRRGLSEEAITAALLIENQQRCRPPLLDEEVRRIAKSVCHYQPEARHNKRPKYQHGIGDDISFLKT